MLFNWNLHAASQHIHFTPDGEMEFRLTLLFFCCHNPGHMCMVNFSSTFENRDNPELIATRQCIHCAQEQMGVEALGIDGNEKPTIH